MKSLMTVLFCLLSFQLFSVEVVNPKSMTCTEFQELLIDSNHLSVRYGILGFSRKTIYSQFYVGHNKPCSMMDESIKPNRNQTSDNRSCKAGYYCERNGGVFDWPGNWDDNGL